jgi:hypothetical protein
MSLDRRCRASSPASASQCSLSIQRPTETAAIHKKRDQNQAQPKKQTRPGSPHSKKLDPLPDHRQYNSFPDLLQSYASSHFGKPFPCRVIAFLREPANPAAKIENPIPALLIRSSLLSRGEFATLPPSDNPHPPAADDSAPTRKSLPAPAPASIHISKWNTARTEGRSSPGAAPKFRRAPTPADAGSASARSSPEYSAAARSSASARSRAATESFPSTARRSPTTSHQSDTAILPSSKLPFFAPH